MFACVSVNPVYLGTIGYSFLNCLRQSVCAISLCKLCSILYYILCIFLRNLYIANYCILISLHLIDMPVCLLNTHSQFRVKPIEYYIWFYNEMHYFNSVYPITRIESDSNHINDKFTAPFSIRVYNNA